MNALKKIKIFEETNVTELTNVRQSLHRLSEQFLVLLSF